MRNFIESYIVESSWFPTIIFLTSLVLCVALLAILGLGIIMVIPLITLILLFISGLVQLIYKKWLPGFINIGLSIVVSVLAFFSGFFFILAMSLTDHEDHFTDDLVIPQEIEFDFPVDLIDTGRFGLTRPDFVEERNHLDFELYNSFQPGIFEYDVWIQTDVPGRVYLKAFEVSKEIPLSVSRLGERSSINIEPTQGAFQKFSTEGGFTIYEGDWGSPYGARFELWFKPEGGGEEHKLLEKNYIIEGWMR